MMRHAIALAASAAALEFVSPALPQVPNTIVLEGSCTEQTHIAEGPRDADLTQHQSRYFCDSVVISVNQRTGTVMFQFADKRSNHQRPIGFAGVMNENNMLTVERVYIEPGVAIAPNEGYCRLFFPDGASQGGLSKISSVVCGAQIDEQDRRIVPVIAFEVH